MVARAALMARSSALGYFGRKILTMAKTAIKHPVPAMIALNAGLSRTSAIPLIAS
jgi:hypothetical protein